jgi:hypothetical protein
MNRLTSVALAVVASVALSACGGASVASQSDAATIACTTQTLTTPIFSTDCSTTAGYDAAVCLAGTPPVCSAGTGTGCTCSGTGTNLWAAVGAVGLCGRYADQTRASWQSALCGTEVLIAKTDATGACSKVQALEADVYAKQTKATNKDIQTADADALRKAAQAIEAAITAAGTDCGSVTPAVP